MRYPVKLATFLLAITPSALLSGDPMPLPGWMAGCWIEDRGDLWIEECWTGPRARMMIGSGRTGRVDELSNFEHMRIELTTDGTLVFWSLPGGEKPTRFVAVHADGDDVIFENAEHDYPQRIRYWRDGEGLKAQISKLDGSQPMDFSWRMMGQ